MTQELADPIRSATVRQPPLPAEALPASALRRDAVRVREITAALALVVLCDLVIYRGHGFAGYAALFASGPLVLLLGTSLRHGGRITSLLGTMLAAVAIKMAWCGSGLLVAAGFALVVAFSMSLAGQCPSSEPVNTPLYAAFRNTLVVVISLFAVYLVFEFRRLWFREFPKGFHYSGFAHQGAAWLTFALALATLLLSLVFRGGVFRDPRIGRLKRLAWLWSIENFILAVAVYHRLWIYVGFNGMTRMRTIGIFGTTTVVAGFVLVLWKIARRYDLAWLVRGQLWVLAIAAYLYALTPVDTLVVYYNVQRILAGDPAPSVEISVHPISAEGVLLLRPLVACEDPIIREGVRAMLAQRHDEAEAQATGGDRSAGRPSNSAIKSFSEACVTQAANGPNTATPRLAGLP